MTGRLSAIALVMCCLPVGALMAQIPAGTELVPRPGPREFVVDLADLLNDEEETRIQGLADKLLTEKMVPVIVLTIPSLQELDVPFSSVDTFAREQFDRWGIGFAGADGGKSWNYGILVVVSKGDRQARIELGADWRGEKDAQCRDIMQNHMIPQFRSENYGGGIVAGVEALDQMARGLELPAAPKPRWYYPAMIGLVCLAIFTAVSLYRRGSSGWAWLFWGVVFTVLFMILRNMGRSRSSGGYSGGSFGGGFGGGGGASGSW